MASAWTSEGIVSVFAKLEAISLPVTVKKETQDALTQIAQDNTNQKCHWLKA